MNSDTLDKNTYSLFRISIVIPVHNEGENIDPLIEEITVSLAGIPDYEIIFIDDASTDDTPTRLAGAAGGDCRIRFIRHLNNCGQSTAIRTGVSAARYDWIVTMDGDGQNDPADIPALVSALGNIDSPVSHLVCGYRLARQDTWVKRYSSRIANAFRRRVLNDSTPDTGCGLKLFSKHVFMQLPYFDHMHRFLPALFLRQGAMVTNTVVNHRPRKKGTSHYGIRNRLWTGIIDMVGVMWLQRRIKHPFITETSYEK